jgi:ribosomal protein S1
LTGFIVNE